MMRCCGYRLLTWITARLKSLYYFVLGSFGYTVPFSNVGSAGSASQWTKKSLCTFTARTFSGNQNALEGVWETWEGASGPNQEEDWKSEVWLLPVGLRIGNGCQPERFSTNVSSWGVNIGSVQVKLPSIQRCYRLVGAGMFACKYGLRPKSMRH